MRLSFFGTPDLSAAYLQALTGRHEVVAAITQPDRPRGRSGAPQPSPVREVADGLGIPVFQPETGQCADACQLLGDLGVDYCVVVAFGQKLPCLAHGGCTRDRCINVHYSLLPQLRGAAPVQHAILQGLETTGVTVQHVVQGWDEGDIVLQRTLAIAPDDTCGTLTERLTDVGVTTLLEALDLLAAGTATRTPQDARQATWAPLVRKADGRINWQEPAELIARKVRAYDPWPGAVTVLDGKPVKIASARAANGLETTAGEPGQVVEVWMEGFSVACGHGALCITGLQPAGKRVMSAAEFLRGARLAAGAQLGA